LPKASLAVRRSRASSPTKSRGSVVTNDAISSSSKSRPFLHRRCTAQFRCSPAFAHNTFIDSSPSDGEVLASAPTSWSVTFEKSVPLDSASGVVVNGDGVRTSLSTPRHGDSDSTVIFDLPPNLSGSINARWRLVGTDGHIISGRVTFTVQDSTVEAPITSDGSISDTSIEVPATTISNTEVLADESTSAPQPIRIALRFANFLSLIIFGGLFFAERFVAGRDATTPIGRQVLLIGAIGSALTPLIQLWIFSNDLGGSLGEALSLTPGVMLVIRAIAGCILFAGCLIGARLQTGLDRVTWQLAASWLVYLVALAYGGHSRSQALPWLGIPTDVLHVTAISSCSVVTLFSSSHGLLLVLKLLLMGMIIWLASRNRSTLRDFQHGDLAANARTKSLVLKSSLKELLISSVILAITAVMVGASLD
jgi:methionine-rich copper-binding protein CopC/putative copper export protein